MFSGVDIVIDITHVIKIKHSCAEQAHGCCRQKNSYVNRLRIQKIGACHPYQPKKQKNKQVAKTGIAVSIFTHRIFYGSPYRGQSEKQKQQRHFKIIAKGKIEQCYP